MADEKKQAARAAETAPDFSKIFASQSDLTPYEWQDADYLKGWNTVGSIPPARTQFDALQRTTDEKLQYLKNEVDDRVSDVVITPGTSTNNGINTISVTKNGQTTDSIIQIVKMALGAQTAMGDSEGNVIKDTYVSKEWGAAKYAAKTELASYVSKAGDTMTGALTLPALDTADNSLKAASTKWVRDLLTSLSLISGAGVVAGDVSNANAWWVKLGGVIPLIIQGVNNTKSGSWPIAFPHALLSISGDYNGVGGNTDWGPSVSGNSTSFSSTSSGSNLNFVGIGY